MQEEGKEDIKARQELIEIIRFPQLKYPKSLPLIKWLDSDTKELRKKIYEAFIQNSKHKKGKLGYEVETMIIEYLNIIEPLTPLFADPMIIKLEPAQFT